jgi:putative peptidoglycan lipid II flippase
MVRRVFNFVYREVRGLHQAAYILAFFAFGSQILAIVRDRLLAHNFGAGIELDLYYAAFRIPDLLFVLFASVLSVYVLLPFVNKASQTHGSEAGAAILSQVFTLFLAAYVLIAAVIMIAAPVLVTYLFPGFSEQSSELVLLMRILLLQPLLLGMSSLCGVVTQMNHRFVLFAISPLLYNLGIILGIAVLYPLFGLAGLVAGVVIGAFGHLIVQVPFVRQSTFSFSFVGKIDWKLLRKVLSVSIPRALTLSVNQIVLLVLVGMASFMAVGSVSTFQFAFNLQSVPLAIIGMSYSVAAFPTLSYLYAKEDHAGFNLQLLTAFRHIIFWSVPIITLVIVLRAQIVRVLLGSGAFDWSDTRLTAALLAIFVLSLLAQAVLLLLIRAFYAGGKTLLPLVVAVCSGAVSVLIAFVLRNVYFAHPELAMTLQNLFRLENVFGAEVLVLAIAFICGQFLQVVVLVLASRKTFSVSYTPLVHLLYQATLAGVAGGLASYIALNEVVDGINQNTFIGVLLQGSVAGVAGVVVVIAVYKLLGSPELKEIYRSFQTKIFKTDVVKPQ